MTRGYLNDLERTKSSYIVDPQWFPKNPSSPIHRFYKTGDLVRYLPDGDIMFVARKDNQVKIRGQRVELGEIEHAILENLDSVVHVTAESVVFPQTGQTLVAFLKIEDFPEKRIKSHSLFLPLGQNMTLNLHRLEKSLLDRLPSYLVPSLFVPIGYVPTTISGKVDRIQLRHNALKLAPAEFEMYSLAGEHKIAPVTTMEKKLRELWAEVLNKSIESIGAEDSFFRLGGDSIGAMNLVNTARAAGLGLSVAEVFRSPELSKMAEHLVDIKHSDEVSQIPSPFQLLPADLDRDTLLSEVSEHYWFPIDNIVSLFLILVLSFCLRRIE